LRLPSLAFSGFAALALARMPELGDEAGLLVFGECSSELAHHLQAWVFAGGEIVAVGG
jgi:hypothetical protein